MREDRLGDLQVTSYKLQATSYKLQATSYKLQATSYRLQATGYRPQATGYRLLRKPRSACTGAEEATTPWKSEGYLSRTHAARAPGYEPPKPTTRLLAAEAETLPEWGGAVGPSAAG